MAQFNARFVQDGNAIDYVPQADTSAGTVVQVGAIVGVTKNDIKAGEVGALALSGVYEVEKASGAISFGDFLYWDASGKKVAKTGSIPFGIAVAAAASADATVRVLINVPAADVSA